MNTLGCYLEGFVTDELELATGISGGFLSVLTSFPDIGESASVIVAETNSYQLGACYCFVGMVCGCMVYSRRNSNSISNSPLHLQTAIS